MTILRFDTDGDWSFDPFEDSVSTYLYLPFDGATTRLLRPNEYISFYTLRMKIQRDWEAQVTWEDVTLATYEDIDKRVWVRTVLLDGEYRLMIDTRTHQKRFYIVVRDDKATIFEDRGGLPGKPLPEKSTTLPGRFERDDVI